MINQLAKTTVDLGGAFSPERIKYSLEMTLLGMCAIFTVLALIWAILSLFKVFLYDSHAKKDTANNNFKESTNVVPEQQHAKVVDVPATTVTDNDATVAAIIAAISAYIASDDQLAQEYSGGFRVVSFKRVRDKASWNSKK